MGALKIVTSVLSFQNSYPSSTTCTTQMRLKMRKGVNETHLMATADEVKVVFLKKARDYVRAEGE